MYKKIVLWFSLKKKSSLHQIAFSMKSKQIKTGSAVLFDQKLIISKTRIESYTRRIKKVVNS